MTGVRHALAVRVYYEDTDFSGVVYHASYLRFLERGRTELLRGLGIDQSALQAAGGAAFAVRHMTLDFLGAARMDDLLRVDTAVAALGGASVTMRQAVMRGETALMGAAVRIALVRAGRPVRLPADLRERLAAGTRALDAADP